MSAVLNAAETHVWRVHLDRSGAHSRALLDCLSPGEKARVEGCATGEARHRLLTSRGTLRHVLARYTGTSPERLTILHGETGKPYLAGNEGIHFSLSHSLDTALIAVARREVGVDMEHVREPLRMLAVARRILHPDTAALLESLPAPARAAAFLDAWTLREAHVKAVGGGLFRTPDTIPFDPAHPADGVPRTVIDRDGAGTWGVVRFALDHSLRAAVVTRGRMDALHVMDAATTNRILEEDLA
jgi:4'-phosphopantetheinyl transferase